MTAADALRRLLDAIYAARDESGTSEQTDLSYAMRFGMLRAPKLTDRLERLALDGLAGEAEPQLGEPCVCCGKRSRITTAACDHCDYEDK
jgi:hypothetical protein